MNDLLKLVVRQDTIANHGNVMEKTIYLCDDYIGRDVTIMDFKEKLRRISNNDNVLGDGDDINEIIDSLLKNIGSLDSELRDDLIYSTFSKLISSKQVDDEKLKWILDEITDDSHLFYKINENDEKSVYTRTFSILIVASALARHRKCTLLNKSELHNIFNKVIKYCKLEKNYHGYDESYGWAHSTAHTADALDELAMCSEFDKDNLIKILDMVTLKICIGDYVYIHEEDERLVTAVINVIKRNEIPFDYLQQWISKLSNITALDDYMMNYAMKLNIKNFLRSIYFRINKEDISLNFKEVIVNTLDKL